LHLPNFAVVVNDPVAIMQFRFYPEFQLAGKIAKIPVIMPKTQLFSGRVHQIKVIIVSNIYHVDN